MANFPPTVNVVRFKPDPGNVQVFPLLPTQLLGTQDGADVGTGGPSVAALESLNASAFANNRVVEFQDDRYCVVAPSAGIAVYRRSQGGAGQWGRVLAGGSALQVGSVAGLHVLHPDGVPTLVLACTLFTSPSLYIYTSTDGTTWGSTVSANVQAFSTGQSIVYRNSVIWAHGNAAGNMVVAHDVQAGVASQYAPPNIDIGMHASNMALHVQNNKLFLTGYQGGATGEIALWRLDGPAFTQIWANTGGLRDGGSNFVGHPALFTDPSSGDLILVANGRNAGAQPETKVFRFAAPETGVSVTGIDISTTVFGAVEGANKYLAGGGVADGNRRWSVLVDNDSDPLNPRTFLWTWTPGSSTECWEWIGTGAEVENVGSFAGIADDFALPYNTVGGGERSPRVAAVEIGDVANNVAEVFGGSKIFFRGRGSGSASTVTFYGTDTEGTPTTVVPIVAASLTVESGSPPTTPTISGNTLVNFTPDNGATLYSVVLDVSAPGVDIGEGDVGLIIANLVV